MLIVFLSFLLVFSIPYPNSVSFEGHFYLKWPHIRLEVLISFLQITQIGRIGSDSETQQIRPVNQSKIIGTDDQIP
jgi:hypothetical protein